MRWLKHVPRALAALAIVGLGLPAVQESLPGVLRAWGAWVRGHPEIAWPLGICVVGAAAALEWLGVRRQRYEAFAKVWREVVPSEKLAFEHFTQMLPPPRRTPQATTPTTTSNARQTDESKKPPRQVRVCS